METFIYKEKQKNVNV